LLYGHSIAKQLLTLKLSSNGKEKPHEDDMDVDQNEESELPDQPESWSAEAYFTSANYQAKKFVFLLFINRALALLLLLVSS
jgi:DNA mismatch repair protein MLH1